jgi:acyl carrier protein
MSIQKLQRIFREVFERDDLEIFPAMTARDVQEWDSFNHINLIVALEEEFGMTFTTDEIAGMSNVGDLVKILQKHGSAVAW